MKLRRAAAIVLAFSVFTAFSCGSQSRQREAPLRESTITSPKAPQAKAGTAACVAGCHIEGLYDQAPGCYVGSIPEMKSYAAPPAGHAVWEYPPKEGPPFPEVMAELCIESDNLGTELHTVNVTTSSPEWNAFFDENRLQLSTEGDGYTPKFALMAEGYLGGVATWLHLEWTCQTTIPDHKRLLCVHSWIRHTGPELDVGPEFDAYSDQKVMYYLVRN